MEKKSIIKEIYIKIKRIINNILGKEKIKEIEANNPAIKSRNKLYSNIKVENNNAELVNLKYQLSNKKISVNDLDNETVKKLIKMYKNSNEQLKNRILKNNNQ